jgi:DNA-binding transcriptional LysR family regulator
MELRHLRYFAAVAETLNFRAASDRLHVAQPALSAQIRTLEAELGVTLFERTTRKVELTAAGRVFLEEAKRVISAAGQAEERARQAGAGLAGTLRLGIIAPTANAWLAGILRRFRLQFPGIQFSLFDLTSTEQLGLLRNKELDVGLLRPPVGFPELDWKLVEESHQVLALPEGHRLARKRALDWNDFDKEPLVLLHPSVQHGYYDAFLRACARGGSEPRVGQYANDIQTKMWLISAGFGIAPTTATLSQVKRPGLMFRPLPDGLPPVHTILVWRRDDTSPILENFREFFPAITSASAAGPRPSTDKKDGHLPS